MFSKLRNNLNEIIFSGLVLTFFTFLGGAIGYLGQIILGRYLDISDYAIFTSIFSLCAFINSPLMGLFLIYSRQVTFSLVNEQNIKEFYYSTIKKSIYFSIFLLILTFFFLDFLEHYLKYETKYLFFITLYFIFNLFLTVNNSFFNGLKKNFFFGLIGTSQQFIRFLFILICIYFLLSIDFVFLFSLLAVLFTLIISNLICLKIIKQTNKNIIKKNEKKESLSDFTYKSKTISVIFASVSFIGFTQLDIFYANLYFKNDAGFYALAAVLGKTILYISHSLSYALFPYSSEASANNNNDKKNLLNILIFTFLIGIFSSIFFFFFSYEILNIIFNKQNDLSSEILKWYGFAITPFALVYIIENYLISKNKVVFAWISILFLPFQFYLIKFHVISVDQILLTFGLTGVLLLFIGSILTLRLLKNNE